MKILIACEESQEVCLAFREQGHEAYSCDIQECSGGHPQYHIQQDVEQVIHGWIKVVHAADCDYEDWDEDMECEVCPFCQIDYAECLHPGPTQEDEYDYKEIDGELYGRLKDHRWDLMIAFPPCTHIAVSGAHRFKAKKEDGRQEDGIKFFLMMANSPIDKWAIENPVNIMSGEYLLENYPHLEAEIRAAGFPRKANQIVQPYHHGDDASKSTGLWLKGLPRLKMTKFKEPRIVDGKKRWDNQCDSGQNKLGPSPTRGKERSKTYNGIAQAMATQWGKEEILNKKVENYVQPKFFN